MSTKSDAGAAAHAVRLRFIEALARRAESHTGEARRRLDERVAALLTAHREPLEHVAGTSARKPPTAAPRTPIGELLDALARHAGPEGAAPCAAPATPTGALTELKSLRRFSATWTRLAADHRLAQSFENVPANAGPLNSQHLVHQALALMREVSPAYLDRFIAQVDALLWLEQATASAKPAPPRR